MIHYHYCDQHADYYVCQCPTGLYYAATGQTCPACSADAERMNRHDAAERSA